MRIGAEHGLLGFETLRRQAVDHGVAGLRRSDGALMVRPRGPGRVNEARLVARSRVHDFPHHVGPVWTSLWISPPCDAAAMSGLIRSSSSRADARDRDGVGQSRPRRRVSTRASALDVRERAAEPANARAGRVRRPPSVELADDSDELSLDAHVVVELRRVGRVGRLETDLVLLLEEALQRDRVLLDLGDDDVAVAGGGSAVG